MFVILNVDEKTMKSKCNHIKIVVKCVKVNMFLC
jgi:hypothetical protein